MPKAYIFDSGWRLVGKHIFPILAGKHGIDAIKFWRTTEGNEVDFVLPNLTTPFAVETKYNEALIKQHK